MQLMPATAAALGVTDRYDPAQNVRGGATYLRSLIERFQRRPSHWPWRPTTPAPARSSAGTGSRRFPKPSAMSSASWRRITAFRVASLALALIVPAGGVAAAGDQPVSLNEILANYLRATSEPGATPIVRLESSGTVSGAGLSGSFHTWLDGNDERDDQSLGPRFDSVLSLDDQVYYRDANGAVRRFTGLMLRRTRTDRFIDSGDFAKFPERVTFRGDTYLSGRRAFILDVSAQGGEVETLYLDSESWLPLQIAYDDDDGRTTIDLSDWRSIERPSLSIPVGSIRRGSRVRSHPDDLRDETRGSD